MDYKAWQTSRRTHKSFQDEEKTDYLGKVRKKKIFVTVEEEEPVLDPKDNVFFRDPKVKKNEHDSTAWLTKDAVVGLMDHAIRMSSGKAGVNKSKKSNSGMSNNDDDGEVRRASE